MWNSHPLCLRGQVVTTAFSLYAQLEVHPFSGLHGGAQTYTGKTPAHEHKMKIRGNEKLRMLHLFLVPFL